MQMMHIMMSMGTMPRVKLFICGALRVIKEAMYSMSTNFASSEGWKVITSNRFSHRFAPFISSPQNTVASISRSVAISPTFLSFSR